jgi:hypothetical protein
VPCGRRAHFFELSRFGAQTGVLSIHLTPGIAKYQPWTVVFCGRWLFSATSGSVGGRVARLERGEDLNASPKWLNII